MKILLTLFVLLFSSSVFAEDISDFEIEGMSVGDSLLEYFSEDNIKQHIEPGYFQYKKDNKFITVELVALNSFKLYNAVQAQVKVNDNKYIIYGLGGMIDYIYNIEDCYSKQNKVVEEILLVVSNVSINEQGVRKSKSDSTGKSTYTGIYLNFSNGDYIAITCYDWSKEIGHIDHLRISMITKKLGDWL